MSGLQHMANEELLMQFTSLWKMLQHIDLQPQSRDNIVWNLTMNGKYSAKLAYDAQYLGRIKKLHLEQVWKIRADSKVQFFLVASPEQEVDC
jgi:hypothetical protein